MAIEKEQMNTQPKLEAKHIAISFSSANGKEVMEVKDVSLQVY